jgi:hypothetical protein
MLRCLCFIEAETQRQTFDINYKKVRYENAAFENEGSSVNEI